MKTYARVIDGAIAEIVCDFIDENGIYFSIDKLYPADFVAELVEITSVTPEPQQNWVYDGSKFSAPPLPAAPSTTQLAALALTAGLTVASTSTSAINATYAIDALSQMDIIAIETSLNAGKGFPGGSAAFNYADMSGVFHAFTAANFTDFAAAVRDYVYALKSVIAGASTTLPPATATIA